MRGNHKSHIKPDERGMHAAARSVVAATASDEGEQAPLDPVIEESLPDEANSGRAAQEAGGRADEDDLIKRSLGGDHDAFEVLVRRYSPRVFNIIGSFFRRRDMVEDISQEVFARSFFSLSSFTLGRSFEAWVAKIAVNACYDHLRAQRRRIEYQMPRTAEQEDEWLELQMLDVARSRHSSIERQREAADISERLLGKLEPEDRLVLVLMDRDGYSV
ncbi:MAG TPA: sigma-70 family RNA polymerase sigma factor, partial [Blastocatellia bacterium]|nr:sigma-70 family RNA polymerase sigma factor [Blastocatellia bacterium]